MNKKEKPVIVSVRSIYSLCNKSWTSMKNYSKFKTLFLYYCIIILGFRFLIVWIFFRSRLKSKHWNDAYICGERLKNVYQIKRKQKMFLVFIRFIRRYSLIFQKQPPRGVLRKRCSENMQQTYRRTWVFSSIFAAYFQNTFSQEHLWRAASDFSCS